MILSLEKAREINPNIIQEDLDSFESMVRNLTNNNFQNRDVRLENISFIGPDIIHVNNGDLTGFRVNSTIEVNDSTFNDGLYVIQSINGQDITVVQSEKPFITQLSSLAIVTLVEYPPDVVRGVKKLIQYDMKMSDKIGIKSESISRMSTTYYDVNATESIEGYPVSLMKFLNKYKKLRWS
ncbi:hypothetical protein [Tepidibacillus marianensis]|uniref:hypothetical protein n=1 Tax=Tepidibacillus marianensis TaxID=3131995 RepID=UPI0030D359C3